MNRYKATASAALLSLGTMTAIAECINFTNTCDGLDITVTNGSVTGTWWNHDCIGGSLPLVGNVSNGEVKIDCIDAACVAAESVKFGWYETLPADGTIDMYVDFGIGLGWELFKADEPYTLTPGSCG